MEHNVVHIQNHPKEHCEEVIEVLGQVWQQCPYDWGIDQYVTVMSEQTGRLILMQIEKFHLIGHSTNYGIRTVPVLNKNLATFQE